MTKDTDEKALQEVMRAILKGLVGSAEVPEAEPALTYLHGARTMDDMEKRYGELYRKAYADGVHETLNHLYRPYSETLELLDQIIPMAYHLFEQAAQSEDPEQYKVAMTLRNTIAVYTARCWQREDKAMERHIESQFGITPTTKLLLESGIGRLADLLLLENERFRVWTILRYRGNMNPTVREVCGSSSDDIERKLPETEKDKMLNFLKESALAKPYYDWVLEQKVRLVGILQEKTKNINVPQTLGHFAVVRDTVSRELGKTRKE